MIINTQRTEYAKDLQLSQLVGKPYYVFPNTTLNEKFKIKSDEEYPDGAYPTLKYIAIGTGGYDMIKDNTGFTYNTHCSMDAALFNQIPFVVRTLDNDLTETEKANYRFRIVELHGNTEYACYYLKLLPEFSYLDSFYKITVTDAEGKLSLFNTETTELLKPVPTDRSNRITDSDNVEYVTKVVQAMFSLSESEMSELKDAIAIVAPDTNLKITEIALCTGMDKEFDTGTEAIFTQVAFFVSVDLDISLLINTGKDFARKIEIGGSEPILLG